VKPTIDISALNEDAFIWASSFGNLKVAQWLLKVKPTINIMVKCGYAFQKTCAEGHLETAQWLLQTAVSYA
jgi:hypothetical protein